MRWNIEEYDVYYGVQFAFKGICWIIMKVIRSRCCWCLTYSKDHSFLLGRPVDILIISYTGWMVLLLLHVILPNFNVCVAVEKRTQAHHLLKKESSEEGGGKYDKSQ